MFDIYTVCHRGPRQFPSEAIAGTTGAVVAEAVGSMTVLGRF